MGWTTEEKKELEKYFKSNITQMTLYNRIHKLNPKRSYESISRTIRKMKENGWIKNKDSALKNLKIGYLDIEASGLNGNFDYIISWFIKERGKNSYDYAVITKKEIFNYKFDYRLVKELLKVIKKYDIIYTHYGSDFRFDFPFIRTRAYDNGLEQYLPNYMEHFLLDTYPTARMKLKLHRNRLDVIADALRIEDVRKTPVLPRVWRNAKVGDPKALEYVKDHNKKDVILLERVHEKLEKVERPIYRSV